MKLFKPLISLILIGFLNSCSNKTSGSTSGAPTPPTISEVGLCQTSTVYTPSVTITGIAQFFKRGLTVTQSSGVVTQMTLSTPISTALPIKFAEIQVLDSNGSVVQCGQTDSSGHLKALDGTSALLIPNTPGSYTVEVFSRSNHSLAVPGGKTAFQILASIKKDIYSNELYKVTSTVTSSGSGTVNTVLIAYARESESSEVLGGAFNIYNSILVSYEYLAQNTGTSNLTCMNTKLHVYWKAGFNPAQYIYPSADPSTLSTVSFYVRGDNQLFINGGVMGDVVTKDTDHFDDAVIIHELGHHVEDACGKMDSPGGIHYGLYRIDPRFSWSEGWGNFFGANMIHNNISAINPDLAAQLPVSGWLHYLDTEGYNDGSVTSGISLILLNLTRPGTNPEHINTSQGLQYYDRVDSTNNPGEGHMREVSISRSLFKVANVCGGGITTCSGTNYFPEVWKAFENDPAGIGMGKSIYPYRSSARFYNRLNAVFAGSMPAAIDNILKTDEAQQRDGNAQYISGGFLTWIPYGIKLVNNGSTACTNSLEIQPRAEAATVTDGYSDQRYSNHFYLIDRSVLPGVTEINLTATKAAGSNVDIDLILYKEGYHYNEDCTIDSTGACTAWGKDTSSTDIVLMDRSNATTLGTSFTKKIQNLDTLSAASYFLLDVRAYTANQPSISSSTAYTYTLKTQTGDYLCPSSTY